MGQKLVTRWKNGDKISFLTSWVAERWYALPEKINAWIAAQEWKEEAAGDEAQAKT